VLSYFLNVFLDFIGCSKSYCPYCVRVKQLLTQLKASYKAIELDAESEYIFLDCAKKILEALLYMHYYRKNAGPLVSMLS